MYDVPSVSSRTLIVTCLQRHLEKFYLKVGRAIRSNKEPLEQEARMMRKKPREDCFKKVGMVSYAKDPEKHNKNL